MGSPRLGPAKRGGYVMQGGSNTAAAGGNPVDGATYYYPLGTTVAFLNTTQGGFQPQIPKTGTIRTITISEVHAGVNGGVEGEAVTYKYSVSGAAAVTLGTTTWNQGLNTYRIIQYDGLSVAVTEGQYVEIIVLAPTWVTNPTTCFVTVNAYIEPS